MKKHWIALFGVLILAAGSFAKMQANSPRKTLIITMTNDPQTNAVMVFDAATHALLQTISSSGKGGVAGNARGVKEYDGKLVAVVNNGSGTVAVFHRAGNILEYEQSVVTSSAPVSIDFGNNHMYVAGATTVDSFTLTGDHVGAMDGTTGLTLVGNSLPPAGSTAQVGHVDGKTLLVTLKTDPTPGTVDVISLSRGAVSGSANAVSAPVGTLTPFGFSVYPDGSAIITLAHSGHDGLFRDSGFKDVVVSGGQAAPCWTTRIGKYVFIANAGSNTISRVVGTGSNIFVDSAVAGAVPAGGPNDLDAAGGYLVVVDHGGASPTSHLTAFTYDEFGNLKPNGTPWDLHVANANGIAVMEPAREAD